MEMNQVGEQDQIHKAENFVDRQEEMMVVIVVDQTLHQVQQVKDQEVDPVEDQFCI